MRGKSLSMDHGTTGEAFHLGTDRPRDGEQTQSSPMEQTQSSPIELAPLIQRCLDDRGFCAMVLHKFAARSADQLAALERAFDSANTRELARQAHTLQGVAANLSAPALRARAEELEGEAVRGDLQAARGALDRTRVELDRCLATIPGLLAHVASRA